MNKASITKVLKDDDNVDYAAAGVKDLNNFKGYHNNNDKANQIEQQHDPITGAHFKHSEIYGKLLNILKNKLQEKTIEKLSGIKVQLDPIYFSGDAIVKEMNKVPVHKI